MTFQKIKIVADSVCDLPPHLSQELGVIIVPCFVNYGGNSYADDGVELVREQFYNELSRIHPHPTTAAPSPGVALEKLRMALEDADHVVCINVPAKLSATLNTMRLAAEQLIPEKITLVDSTNVSLGIGFQVIAAAQVARETGDLQQVLETIEAVRRSSTVYATAETMEYLKRSGRVSAVVASVGSLLQIKPVIRIQESEVHPAARVRTFSKALDKLIEYAEADAPLEKLAVLHINNPDAAQEVKSRLSHLLPEENIFFGMIGPTIGTHIGPGAVGVGTLKKWRK